MASLLSNQFTTSFSQNSETQFQQNVKVFGKTSLRALSIAAFVSAVVGAIGLFGSLVAISMILPLSVKISFVLVGTGVGILSLLLKNKFYPNEKECSEESSEEDDQNISKNMAALAAEVRAALSEIRAFQKVEEKNVCHV